MTTTVADSTASLSNQAQVVLHHRYLLKNSEGRVSETSVELFRRVAEAVASNETQYYALDVEADLIETEFFHMLLLTCFSNYIILQKY